MSVMRFRATGAAAIASTLVLDPERAFQLVEIRLHLDAAGGAAGDVNFTATLDSNAGTAYDFEMVTEDLTLLADYLYQPTKPIIFDKGDEIDFAYANAGSATYGLLVIYELI